jgi:hypothetical protein
MEELDDSTLVKLFQQCPRLYQVAYKSVKYIRTVGNGFIKNEMKIDPKRVSVEVIDEQ